MTRPELLVYLTEQIRSNGVGGLTTAEDLRDFLSQLIGSVYDQIDVTDTELRQLLDGYVSATTVSTISGAKTFSTTPKSTGDVVDATDLITKAYFDANNASNVTDIAFNGNRAIKRAVDGLEGVNLGTTSVITLLEQLLYPTLAPTAAISLAVSLREMGDTTQAAISWTATKTDTPITAINVAGDAITPTGNTQSGTLNKAVSSVANTTFSIIAQAGALQGSASVVSAVKRKIRIGYSTKNGVGQPILDTDVRALAGYFADSKNIGPLVVAIPDNNHMVIECPVSLGVPVFEINGFDNNDFTLVRSNDAYVNAFGFSDTVNVWVSNNFMTGTNNLILK